MTKLTNRFAALCALAGMAGVAAAQSDNPWNGVYAGLNAGGAWNDTCVSETLNGAAIDPAIATTFYNQSCPNSVSFVGGAQIGDNFQYKRLVFGIGADLDLWSSKNHDQSFKYAGAAPPPGTYDFSGKLSPSDFGIISARMGYASLQWLPYIKVGTIITGGSHDSTLSYTPTGAKAPTASFNGGRSFASAGWVAGGGAEYGLNGPWSITAEYLYANLGKGSSSTTTCAGSATACTPFSGISLDSNHSSFTAHMIRIGINYWFSYWGQ